MWSNNDGMDPNWRPDFPAQSDKDKEIAKLKAENAKLVEAARELAEYAIKVGTVKIQGSGMVQELPTPLAHLGHKVKQALLSGNVSQESQSSDISQKRVDESALTDSQRVTDMENTEQKDVCPECGSESMHRYEENGEKWIQCMKCAFDAMV